MACDTKERIIEEALRLFSEKGYAGTSMSDIAERLKITKAALYKHYSGKREIFQKILDRTSNLTEQTGKQVHRSVTLEEFTLIHRIGCRKAD